MNANNHQDVLQRQGGSPFSKEGGIQTFPVNRLRKFLQNAICIRGITVISLKTVGTNIWRSSSFFKLLPEHQRGTGK
jgi:hypothetical protein